MFYPQYDVVYFLLFYHFMIKILIVDDQSTIVATLSYVLRKIADVIPSESLREAQNALSKDKFDLVISDLRLTGTDGKE
jgi:DNA-binding NtrC family response regulator